jgi:hypothetical protein
MLQQHNSTPGTRCSPSSNPSHNPTMALPCLSLSCHPHTPHFLRAGEKYATIIEVLVLHLLEQPATPESLGNDAIPVSCSQGKAKKGGGKLPQDVSALSFKSLLQHNASLSAEALPAWGPSSTSNGLPKKTRSVVPDQIMTDKRPKPAPKISRALSSPQMKSTSFRTAAKISRICSSPQMRSTGSQQSILSRQQSRSGCSETGSRYHSR